MSQIYTFPTFSSLKCATRIKRRKQQQQKEIREKDSMNLRGTYIFFSRFIYMKRQSFNERERINHSLHSTL